MRACAQFAGPCARGVLDPVMIPRPMSPGCAGLIDPIVQFKDYAFPGSMESKSVLPVGYSLILVERRAQKTTRQTLAGSSEMVSGRARANLEPTWG